METRKANGTALRVVYFALSLFWFGVMTEIVNQVSDPETGHGTLTYRVALAGLIAWAVLENYWPALAHKLSKGLLVLSAASTILVYFEENTFTCVLVGVCAGSVATHAISRLADAFSPKRRFMLLSIGIGFYSASVTLFFQIADVYFLFLDFETALPYIFLLYALIPFALLALSFKLPREAREKTTEIYPMPSGKWLIAGIFLLIVLFTCLSELVSKAFILTADVEDPFLTFVWTAVRILRVIMFPLLGLMVDKRKWRLAATIPVVCMVLGGAISLFFSGKAATACILFLFGIGGGFVVYFVFLLPMMIAPRFKNNRLVACLGVIFYWIVGSVISATALENNLGELLLSNQNTMFAAVTLLSIPFFLLLLEFFLRQRNMELTQEFQVSAVQGTLTLPPEPEEPTVPTLVAPPLPIETADFDTVAQAYALTRREREILPYLLSPMTADEIAKETYVSVNTVRTHIRNVLAKTQLPSRRELQKQMAVGVQGMYTGKGQQ